MSLSRRSDPTAAVIGGGPAGLMAAEVLAVAGFSVDVFDHKPSVGRKFLLAGRGGLNITHTEPVEQFTQRYGKHAHEMSKAIGRFGPDALRVWCEELGEPTFVGSSGRVFPASFRATPLLRAWLARLDALGVVLRPRHWWVGFDRGGDPPALRFVARDDEELEVDPDVVVMALGGASWPRVGSDGGWVNHLVEAGVEVDELQPANCGLRVAWTDIFIERSSGDPIKNAMFATAGVSARGDCVITDQGIEGGPVYALAAEIREQLAHLVPVPLIVDLQPDLSVDQLQARLTNRRAKETTTSWLRRSGFGPTQVGLLREATGNVLPVDPSDMAALIKSVPIQIASLMPIERAISTAGGVSFDAVDDNLMLRALPGVFVAGEMLTWEAPTGGYLLQGCFSTAVVAAEGAAAWVSQGPRRALNVAKASGLER